jgi:hypothetical protein
MIAEIAREYDKLKNDPEFWKELRQGLTTLVHIFAQPEPFL